MQTKALVAYLDRLLQASQFNDYAPNGLQVSGADEVKKVVTGVTASLALIEAAIEVGADTILVHHGYFWKNEQPTLTSYKQRRIQKLLNNNINLIAYHLPLDAHPELGNNAQLAKLWQLEVKQEQESQQQADTLLWLGQLQEPLLVETFIQCVAQTLNRQPLHLPGGPEVVQNIAWCSGGAQHFIEQAADWGADMYISGEVSEQTTHLAKELGIHYLAAGHHATERYGVKALGVHLRQKFDLEVQFIDIDNPV